MTNNMTISNQNEVLEVLESLAQNTMTFYCELDDDQGELAQNVLTFYCELD